MITATCDNGSTDNTDDNDSYDTSSTTNNNSRQFANAQSCGVWQARAAKTHPDLQHAPHKPENTLPRAAQNPPKMVPGVLAV